MKIKFNKSLILIVAVIALLFFMSMRSNADGMTKKYAKRGKDCGWINGEIVNCRKSFCSVEPKENGSKGKCVGKRANSWKPSST